MLVYICIFEKNLLSNMPNEKDLSKLALITVLKKCTPEVRARIIEYLNPEGIKVLSEVVFNVLFNGNFTRSQKRKLRKEYAKDQHALKELSKKHTSLKRKRQLLKQTGGFMGTLLGKLIDSYSCLA